MADGSAYGDGLANADLTGDDAQQRFGDAEPDPSNGFLVTRARPPATPRVVDMARSNPALSVPVKL